MRKISILFLFIFIIFINCKKDPTKPDPTPSFELIEIKQSPAVVHLGETVSLTAVTYNPDNDTLHYFWSTTHSSYNDIETNPAVWTAPDSVSQATITVEVTDSQNLSETITQIINVGNQPPQFNQFIIERKEIIIGNTISIGCSAADADNQTISYEWFTDSGSLVNILDTQVVWTAPQTPSKCKIWVNISDSIATITSDTLELNVYREYGCVWVVERGSKKIKKFTDEGVMLFEIGNFNDPIAIQVNPRDLSCWVSDAYSQFNEGKLVRISFNGDTITNIGNFTQIRDIDFFINEKDVWALDSEEGSVHNVSAIDFSLKKSIEGFNHPEALQVDQTTREIWIADTDNNRIVKLSAEIPDSYNVNTDSGYHEITIIQDPTDIAVDRIQNAVWVAQRFQNRITYLREGESPVTLLNLNNPMCVEAGTIAYECWISDTGKNQLLKMVQGSIELTVTHDFLLPTKIDMNIWDGSFWVIDSANNRLVKVDDNGNILNEIIGLNNPWDISINLGR